MERRLAAILAADVVGYARLIGADEEGTIDALRRLRSSLIDPKIAEHGGRIVKSMGDGLLLEFPSVVNAAQYAVEMQKSMAARNAGVPPDSCIEFRIGINVGDIVIDGDDILGDGMNIAARLEGLAEPGGICVSQRVYEEIESRLDVTFRNAGAQSVKNIARPLEVWLWKPSEHSSPKGSETETAPLPTAEKPSIAVLPLDNMSGDPEQDYFADGITEDIITGLSRQRWLLVIARNTSFTSRHTAMNVTQLGRELGVQYVLEGSVRRGGNRVRVTAQLIDAHTGMHVWANAYDGVLHDVFALQDEVTAAIVSAVGPEITAAEIAAVRRDRPHSRRAWVFFHRALQYSYELTEEGNREAVALLRQAVETDPEFALGHAHMARCHVLAGIYGWGGSGSEQYARALDECRLAMELDPANPSANCALSLAFSVTGRGGEAIDAAQRAVELDPNMAEAHGNLGWTLALSGRVEEAQAELDRAFRGSPRDPLRWMWTHARANAYFAVERYDEALRAAEHAVRERPQWLGSYIIIAASSANLGRMKEAGDAIADLKRRVPRFSLVGVRKNPMWTRPADIERLLAALHKAGLEE